MQAAQIRRAVWLSTVTSSGCETRSSYSSPASALVFVARAGTEPASSTLAMITARSAAHSASAASAFSCSSWYCLAQESTVCTLGGLAIRHFLSGRRNLGREKSLHHQLRRELQPAGNAARMLRTVDRG